MTEQPPDPWSNPDPPGPPPPPPPLPPSDAGWTVGPPPAPPKKSRLPWIVAVVALVALVGTGYALQRERTDNKLDRRQDAIDRATDRVTENVQESLAREPDVDNTAGTEPKALLVTGGDSGTTFTLQVPPGWEGRLVGKKVLASAVEAFISGEASDGFAPNIVVEVTTIDVDGAPLDRLADQALESSARQLPGLKPVGAAEDVDVGGEDGLAQDYTAQIGAEELSAQLVVCLNDDRAYFFYLSALPAQRAEAQRLFDDFLSGIEFE